MDAIWDRIEAWLAANAPGVLASLNPPATAADIAATEALIGRPLPDDVKAAYRQHDGQAEDGWGLLGTRVCFQWLSLEEVRRLWALHRDFSAGASPTWPGPESKDETVARGFWNSGWVPVTDSGSMDHHCVDLTGRLEITF